MHNVNMRTYINHTMLIKASETGYLETSMITINETNAIVQFKSTKLEKRLGS